MSTTLAIIESPTNKDVQVDRFFGGKDRGTCIQLGQGLSGSVQLTRAQAEALVKVLKEENFIPESC